MTILEAIELIENGYGEGIATIEEQAEALQCLIDDGIVWHLQGFYGRLASAYIKAGLCHEKGVDNYDSRDKN